MKLTTEAFARAKAFLERSARPLERALFHFAFEGGVAHEPLARLRAFRNEDGGFGRGLEPDLQLPASSVLATAHGLHVLRGLETPAAEELATGAIDWLVSAFDPELGAWRSVPQEAEDHPHAGHWAWDLHRDGSRWPVGVLPRAEVLAHLHRAPDRVPAALLAEQTANLVADLERAEPNVGPDALVGCDLFVRTPQAPAAAREAVARRLRQLGEAMVSRDPASWGSYVTKPLKIAPDPEAALAEVLAQDVQRNLDYEIAHQAEDGSWGPNWSWNGNYPEAWEVAETAWRGHLTLGMLHSLRAYGRIEASAWTGP
jgi:hypothetical protein